MFASRVRRPDPHVEQRQRAVHTREQVRAGEPLSDRQREQHCFDRLRRHPEFIQNVPFRDRQAHQLSLVAQRARALQPDIEMLLCVVVPTAPEVRHAERSPDRGVLGMLPRYFGERARPELDSGLELTQVLMRPREMRHQVGPCRTIGVP